MKKIERLFLVFPILILFFIMVNLIWFFEKHTWQSIGSLLFFTYLFPVFCARVVLKIWPIKEGGSIFGGGRGFSSWLILHRIQLIYILFPVLERVLLTFPGAYSFWLRLWGSKIGAKVYWSPTIEVVDRTHLHIGNNVFMGSKIHFCSHVVRPNDDRLFLYVKKIEIGDNVFIGAGSRFGPGSKVAKGVMVPLLTDLKVNEKIYE